MAWLLVVWGRSHRGWGVGLFGDELITFLVTAVTAHTPLGTVFVLVVFLDNMTSWCVLRHGDIHGWAHYAGGSSRGSGLFGQDVTLVKYKHKIRSLLIYWQANEGRGRLRT